MAHFSHFSVAVTLLLGLAIPAGADSDIVRLRLKDHRFEPQSIEIPAHTRVKLLIFNMDNTAEEFDSDDLHREKVIPAGMEAAVYVGPLDAGSYKFAGEYHAATANGTLVVK